MEILSETEVIDAHAKQTLAQEMFVKQQLHKINLL